MAMSALEELPASSISSPSTPGGFPVVVYVSQSICPKIDGCPGIKYSRSCYGTYEKCPFYHPYNEIS